ncbi:hypothetical protein KC19_6G213100 [Ceratodon purpureus]|uniref:Uncharacterized protein n=1 Tax=Ceratodon purpureus TaxID=3225 RepID=A0A8T0HJZ8_CERPU|nr:hypothetical protein KC19_6G213100 [Ceratodon purpureus]
MEGVKILACNSSLQASLSLRGPVPRVRSIGGRSRLIGFRLRREERIFAGRRELRSGLEVVRIYGGPGRRPGADECCGGSASTGAAAGCESDGVLSLGDSEMRLVSGNEREEESDPLAKQVIEAKDFLAVNWARLQVVGWLAVVAFGIGASAASASVSGIKPSRRYGPPCFASVSSISDKGPDSMGQGETATPADSTKGHDQNQGSGDSHEQPVDSKGGQGSDSSVDVKNVEIVGHEDEGDEEFDDYNLAEDEGEDAESDGEVGSDDEGMDYPTIGDLEDLDELGELASGAAAAELLSGSGEIESAEAEGERGLGGDTEDEDLKKAFEEWKSKPYALTVPLRIVGLRGSVPPAWLKEFLMSQGKNAKVSAEFKSNLSDILTDLAYSMEHNQITPKSTMAADLVTVGDSWLSTAVQGGLIEPIRNAEQFDWFKRLHPRWQSYLKRDTEGILDPNGLVWGVPYRWGSLVFAYRKDKLEKNGIAPIKDWKDLFQPKLAGRVAMVESPREVVGSVLKSLGASYNSTDFDAEVPGGRDAVKERFAALQKQVRLFDDNDYLKAMGAGDVWVVVGWSSDVIPYSKRASNIGVYAPESGTSLWADLWAIPAATAFDKTENIGGRVRGPSPLVFQWLDFCLQPARASTFVNDVFVGASPLAWTEKTGAETSENSIPGTVSTTPEKKSKPVVNMDTNIVHGMPPDDVVAKSEFLEPLTEKGLTDYQWLLSEAVEVEGWPSTFNEFVKGIALTLNQWRHPDGSRG